MKFKEYIEEQLDEGFWKDLKDAFINGYENQPGWKETRASIKAEKELEKNLMILAKKEKKMHCQKLAREVHKKYKYSEYEIEDMKSKLQYCTKISDLKDYLSKHPLIKGYVKGHQVGEDAVNKLVQEIRDLIDQMNTYNY